MGIFVGNWEKKIKQQILFRSYSSRLGRTQYNQSSQGWSSRENVYEETRYQELARDLEILVPYLNNSSEETIFGSNKIKEQHETMKLQNEVSSLKTLFINELEQTSLQQTVHKWEKVLIEKSYYSILTLTKSKYFVSYIIKLQCKQGDVLGGEQDRNRQQRIFRKILTIYIRKCWSKDEFFMTLKLILDFLFTDFSQHLRIYLVIFALK